MISTLNNQEEAHLLTNRAYQGKATHLFIVAKHVWKEKRNTLNLLNEIKIMEKES